jgi:hypothetical protein
LAIVKITPTNEKSVCTAGETCRAQFSVSNTSGGFLLCGVQISSQDNVNDWINIEGSVERKIEEDIDTTITLEITPPKDLLNENDTPRHYAFRLRLYNAKEPEATVESPTVSVTVKPAKAENSKPFPWVWALAVIPVIAVIGVVVWLLQSPSGEKYTFIDAKQISDHPSGYGFAEKAIDGNTDGQWQNNNSNTLTRTNGRAEYEWWQGDLGKSRDIGRVVLHNRTDCCGRWLGDFHILISDEVLGGLPLERAKAKSNKYFHYPETVSSDVGNASYTWEAPANTQGRYIMVMTTPQKKNAFLREKANLEREIIRLEQKMTNLSNGIIQTGRGITRSEQTITDSKKEIPVIQRRIIGHEKQIANSKKQILSLQQEIKKLTVILRPGYNGILKSKGLLPQVAYKLDDRKSKKAEHTRLISTSQRQRITFIQRKAALEKQISDSEQQMAIFKKNKTDFEKNKTELEKEKIELDKKKTIFDKEASNIFLALAEVEVFSPSD